MIATFTYLDFQQLVLSLQTTLIQSDDQNLVHDVQLHWFYKYQSLDFIYRAF